MDSEKLIFLVFDRRILWDQRSKGYHNRDKSRKLWEEVAAELNVSSDVAKTKWKGLRDTFRREYQKSTKLKQSGAAGGEKSGSSWPYYDSLIFLADQMSPRETSGNIPLSQQKSLLPNNGENDEPDSPETENAEDDHPDGVLVLPSTSSAPSTSTTNHCKQYVEEQNPSSQNQQHNSANKKQQSRPAKRARNDVEHKMLALEEEKLNIFKQRKVEADIAKDYDYHFLLSLLPHFKNIKPERKLSVQVQVQQVLLDEITSYSQSDHSSQRIGSDRPSEAHVLYNTTPQCEPSPVSTHYTLNDHSSASPFSPTSISQHSYPSTSNNAGPDDANSNMEDQDSSYNIATFVSNFQI